MKYLLTGTFLLVLFLALFCLHVDYMELGPSSDSQHDALDLKTAWYDQVSGTLILAKENIWARVEMKEVAKANRTLGCNPGQGNILHWTSFRDGQPPPEAIRGMEKIAIGTRLRATAATVGLIVVDSQRPVAIPDGYAGILVYSDAEPSNYTPTWLDAQEHHYPLWYPSYILLPRPAFSNELYEGTFFFSPDYARAFTFVAPSGWLPFYLTFVAFALMLVTVVRDVPFSTARRYFYVALAMHIVAFLGYLLLIRLATGLGWGNAPRLDIEAGSFLVLGLGSLSFLLGISYLRSLRRQT